MAVDLEAEPGKGVGGLLGVATDGLLGHGDLRLTAAGGGGH